jgi:TonB-dependent SusC/RagA subfamily outer membrane receptor
MKLLIIFLLTIFVTASVAAQHRAVYGTVYLSNDLYLSNISVSAKKAGTQTRTDSLGNFTIVCNEKDVLIFEGKTFNNSRKRITSKTDSVKVQMYFTENPENVKLAVGYGYISKERATHAQSMLTNKQDDFCSYSNIFELINGKCPGVRVNYTANSPGAEQEINIRGKNSLTASTCALYVVDGIIVSQIGNIAPCSVKSIHFLKDASAAIYGARGANGVVIIETIRGL